MMATKTLSNREVSDEIRFLLRKVSHFEEAFSTQEFPGPKWFLINMLVNSTNNENDPITVGEIIKGLRPEANQRSYIRRDVSLWLIDLQWRSTWRLETK